VESGFISKIGETTVLTVLKNGEYGLVTFKIGTTGVTTLVVNLDV
jgi:hypothetical protein